MALSARTAVSPLLLCLAGAALAACGAVAAEPHPDAGPEADAGTGDSAIADGAVADVSKPDAKDAAGGVCTTDADCGGGDYFCTYDVAARCAAKGTCRYLPDCPNGAACGPTPPAACGCNGKPVEYIAGYTKAPVRGPNPCGANEIQKCTTETTCGDDELCVDGFCTTQCMDSNVCGPGGACDHTNCYGPHGCNPPPVGQGCPPVCMGICESVDDGTN